MKGENMEIFTLLETIEDMLENSKEVPFTHKAIIDKEEVLDIIKEIRLKLPEELKQAKVIKEEHDRIISKANEEASEIVKEAENRIISMIDEHEITRKAYEQKNKIIENANDMAREISNGTKAYADNILAGVQVTLEDALKVIENNRKEVTVENYLTYFNILLIMRKNIAKTMKRNSKSVLFYQRPAGRCEAGDRHSQLTSEFSC